MRNPRLTLFAALAALLAGCVATGTVVIAPPSTPPRPAGPRAASAAATREPIPATTTYPSPVRPTATPRPTATHTPGPVSGVTPEPTPDPDEFATSRPADDGFDPTFDPSPIPSLFSAEDSVPFGGYAKSYRGIGRSPCDVAIAPDGNVVMAAASGQLTKIEPATGKFMKTQGVTSHPIGIAYDPQGRLWVSDWYYGKVVVLDADWKEIFETEVGEHPHDVRIDSHGDAWVIAYSQVTKVGPDGKVLGTYPTDPGPLRMKLDAQDNLWIACDGQSGPATRDGDGATLMKLAPDGTKLWSQKRDVDDLAFDAAGVAWVVNERRGTIAKLAADGTQLTSWETPEDYYVSDYGGWRIAIGPRGQIWIVNHGSLNQLSSAGVFERTYRLGGFAYGIAFDRAGKVWLPFNSEESAGMITPSQP